MHPTRPSSIYSCWVACEMMIFSLLVLVSPMYERKSDWENHHKSVNHALCDPCQPWAGKKKSSRSADLQLHVEGLQIPKPVTRGTWRRSCYFDPLKGWRIQAFGVENLPFFQLPLELQYAVSLERCPFPTKFLNKEYQNINHSGMSLPWIRRSQLNSLL